MTKVVTPSTITAGQIGKLQDLLAAALRKSGLSSEVVQPIIEIHGATLVAGLVTELRMRVEAMSNIIVRRVPANRTRSPEETLKATGRKLYLNDRVVKVMPRGEGDEVEVVFFKLDLKGGYIADDLLEKEYALRNLIPSDPYSLAAVNGADPAFADKTPNCTHWKDAGGKWCYAAFGCWRDGRHVDVFRYDSEWSDSWWFAGLRK